MKERIRCLIVDDEPVAREVLEEHLGKVPQAEIVASCKNAMDAFSMINSTAVDLVFLDINMPGVSGLSFARSITRDIKVIFTTAYREYAVDGFDLRAVDYLLKPISFERLMQAITKYLDEQVPARSFKPADIPDDAGSSFFVRSDRKMIRIDYDAITFIESLGDYLKIHLEDRTVVTRETLSNIEARLPSPGFLRVHRSYIVAIGCIDSFTSEYLEVGKREIPISRSYRDQVMRRLDPGEHPV